MRTRIYPYKQGSRSAKALARAINGKVLFTDDRSKFRPRASDVVVNWGASAMPMIMNGNTVANCLNSPTLVARAINKLAAFKHLSDDIVPPYTEDRDVAKQWLTEDLGVVARTSLTASGGAGILLYFPENGEPDANEIAAAPLYTQYIKKQDEYRIHIYKRNDGEEWVVFDWQRKAKRRDDVEVNYQIRNHSNGWVFIRDGVEIPEPVMDVASTAMFELDLDFGAVDVIYNRKKKRAYVLEVNTAPGLEGQTLDSYAEMITKVSEKFA